MTSRTIEFCSAVERSVFLADDALSSVELVDAADALDAEDMRAIGRLIRGHDPYLHPPGI